MEKLRLDSKSDMIVTTMHWPNQQDLLYLLEQAGLGLDTINLAIDVDHEDESLTGERRFPYVDGAYANSRMHSVCHLTR